MMKRASNTRPICSAIYSCSCLLSIVCIHTTVASETSDLAQQEVHASDLKQSQSLGFYLGAKAGAASYVDTCITKGISCSDTTFGYGLFGGYTFDQLFSVELSVNDYGSPQAKGAISPEFMSNVDVKVRGAEVGIRFALPKLWHLAPYFRVGTHYIDSEQTLHSQDGTSHSGYNGWRPSLALGMTYPLAKRWNLQLEYQYVDDIGNKATMDSDLGFLSLGLSYRFGQPSWARPAEQQVREELVREENVGTELNLIDDTHVSTASVDEPALVEERYFKYLQQFDYNSDTLNAPQSLTQWVSYLPNEPADIVIIGHTDSIGSNEYNQQLSDRRANAVAKVITKAFEQGNKVINSIKIQGMGEHAPVDTNQISGGRANNRRVEISIDYSEVESSN
ncbi:outer membrane beta-barrel protein [Shewanella sp. MBTL60-007]|uniref:outer membrane beta-barrel protein n=1 Tax=Shewanella sp. MBTL60-007 TaxID=2815911 RepID=UPI001C805618|nr:outer membrane beta-barrel protein [Shewanella sp. MBTL60-007]